MLRLERDVTGGQTLTMSLTSEAQTVKVGLIENMHQNLPSYLCRNKVPSALDSGYLVSYSLIDYAA